MFYYHFSFYPEEYGYAQTFYIGYYKDIAMARYRCRNCNYSFAPKAKEKVPRRCPYCSEFDTLLEERSILDSLDINDETE